WRRPRVQPVASPVPGEHLRAEKTRRDADHRQRRGRLAPQPDSPARSGHRGSGDRPHLSPRADVLRTRPGGTHGVRPPVLPASARCDCGQALTLALWTARDKLTPELREFYGPLLARVLR